MSTATIDINGKKASLPTGLFINGGLRKAQAGKTFPSENPATGQEII
jgi:aldehyde dehydrogenase (NAD+)